jgi:predicted Zn finger-like uncharacterized protein
MQLSCPKCSARLYVDDTQLAGQTPAKVKCWMCGESLALSDALPAPDQDPPTIVISTAKPVDSVRARAQRLNKLATPETTSLTLPQNQTIRISVISGPSTGLEADLSRPLETIGRAGGGADIEIDDAEVSRLHCSIEVREDTILLHDLRSMNGTFIGETRVMAGRLEHLSTFRIGTTVLQVSIISAASK